MKKHLVLAVLGASYAQAHPAHAHRRQPAPALNLSSSTISNLQVALFLENTEIAYLRQVTEKKTVTAENIKTLVREDETHRQALHDILTAAGTQPVSPCQYTFSNDSASSLNAAGQTLSAARTGAALDLLVNLPAGDAILAPGLAAMAAAEARHQNTLSTEVWKTPEMRPFDASMPASWAFNIARHFVIPDSCPMLPPVSVIPPLKGRITIDGANPVIKLDWQASDLTSRGITVEPLFISWLSRPGGPVHTPMRLNNVTSGEWGVPKGVLGTTFVALTTQAQFTTYEELRKQVVAGPAVVTIRQSNNGTVGH